MPHDPRSCLRDMIEAAREALQFCSGRSFGEYKANSLLRAGTERKLFIVGEALTRLHKSHPQVAAQISQRRSIINFRNFLGHCYDAVDDEVVWKVIENDVPTLIGECEVVLKSLDAATGTSNAATDVAHKPQDE